MIYEADSLVLKSYKRSSSCDSSWRLLRSPLGVESMCFGQKPYARTVRGHERPHTLKLAVFLDQRTSLSPWRPLSSTQRKMTQPRTTKIWQRLAWSNSQRLCHPWIYPTCVRNKQFLLVSSEADKWPKSTRPAIQCSSRCCWRGRLSLFALPRIKDPWHKSR